MTPLVDQPLGRHMRRIPAQRPVDGEPHSRLLDGRKDPVGVGERGGERLFQQDVDAERGDLFDHVRMSRGRRTEDGEIRDAPPARIARHRDRRARWGWRSWRSRPPSSLCPCRTPRRSRRWDARRPRAGGRPCACVRNSSRRSAICASDILPKSLRPLAPINRLPASGGAGPSSTRRARARPLRCAAARRAAPAPSPPRASRKAT